MAGPLSRLEDYPKLSQSLEGHQLRRRRRRRHPSRRGHRGRRGRRCTADSIDTKRSRGNSDP